MWLQSGIRNDEARALADEAGIDFAQDRCIMVEHMQRRGEAHLIVTSHRRSHETFP